MIYFRRKAQKNYVQERMTREVLQEHSGQSKGLYLRKGGEGFPEAVTFLSHVLK